MKRTIKLILGMTLALMAILPFTSMLVSAEGTKVSTEYVDAEGGAKGPVDCTPITSSTTGLSEGWYVVNDDVTVSTNTFNVNGDVKLILADGKTLTVTEGIILGNSSSLTIYGQSGGTGRLVAKSIYDDSLTVYGKSSTITINGGTVDVNAPEYPLKVGLKANTVNINGGTVNSSGFDYGIFAINVNIGGGTVTASGDYFSGIKATTVSINGGTVTASSRVFSGIEATTVSINGGTVTASSRQFYGIEAIKVYINGGTVTASGPNGEIFGDVVRRGTAEKKSSDENETVYADHDLYKSDLASHSVMVSIDNTASKFEDFKAHALEVKTETNQKILADANAKALASLLGIKNPATNIIWNYGVYPRKDLSLTENGSKQTLKVKVTGLNKGSTVSAQCYSQKDGAYLLIGSVDDNGYAVFNNFILRDAVNVTIFTIQ